MAGNEWLMELTEGQEVVVAGGNRDRVATVDRVTPTLIIVCGRKFRRETGRPLKSLRFDYSRLCPATDEAKLPIVWRETASTVKARLDGMDYNCLSLAQWQRIEAIIREGDTREGNEA